MPSSQDNFYLHVDGDSFFVACELTVRPELRGKPVIVGADRGIAVAMSKEAKDLGITRGMPVFKIKKFYPEVVILSHHFSLYKDIARRLFEILSSYFSQVEEYSIDECFALVEPWEVGYFKDEKELLVELQKEIQTKLGVSYSLGLARTKALAKLASKLEKPHGLVMLLSKNAEEKALKQTPIDDVWGIGWRTVPRMRMMGFKTAYDFVVHDRERIAMHFSKPIQVLQKELDGEEVLRVESHTDPRDQKSIQSTATFRPSSNDLKVICRELSENTELACRVLRALNLLTNKVSFFVKTSEFKYLFQEITLSLYTADPGVILESIEFALPTMLTREKIRSTGVILHNLIRREKVSKDLFGKQEKVLNNLVIEQAADKIRKKFGNNIIRRAASLGKETREQGSSFT
jgi:nucleotidyltransferase/DNA polymerase involved in DNA repair